MKFEIRPHQYDFKDRMDDEEYLELYITKNNFIKSYEQSKSQCFLEFSYIIEMYTTPHCFGFHLKYEDIDFIYNTLKSTSTYKGVVLGVKEIYDYSINELGYPQRRLFLACVK